MTGSGEDPVGTSGAAQVAQAAWLDDEPVPLPVQAGAWALSVRGASVEDVSYRGHRLVAALRVVVRDHDWRTVPVRLVDADVHVDGDHARVVLEAEHDDLGAGVRWRGTLTVGGDRLLLAVDGRFTRAFRRNRVGIVVLHPLEVAGRTLRVRHPDGSRTATAFPVAIAPHQPARDVAGLTWPVEGAEVTLSFAGEVFEMEDQRNWTDASFKTYSTPLDLPFPVPVSPGYRFSQAVELTVAGATGVRPAGARSATGPSEVVLTPTGRCLPELQVGASTAPGVVVGHVPWWGGPLLVELDATGRGWPGVLARARREAGGAPLDVRITAEQPGQLDPVVAALRDGSGDGSSVPVARVAVYDAAGHVTTPVLWRHLRERAGHLPLAGGTRAHFTELNRRLADLPADLPALTFSSTPQMHDTGRRQLLESIAVQRLTAEQAVRMAGGRPVHVGPVTLRPRFDAVATSVRRPGDSDVVVEGTGPHQVWGASDPRQAGSGFAAWLLASVQAFGVAGVASITVAETWGPRGLGTLTGSPFPAAEPLRWLYGLRGRELLDTPLVPGRGVLAARRAGGTTVLVADLTGFGQQLRVGDRVVRVPAWGVVRTDVATGTGRGRRRPLR